MERHRFSKGHHQSGPRDAYYDPEVDAPIERTGVAPPISMVVEVAEVALAVAPPTLPTIIEEEEV